jgi:hypothetical protein
MMNHKAKGKILRIIITLSLMVGTFFPHAQHGSHAFFSSGLRSRTASSGIAVHLARNSNE